MQEWRDSAACRGMEPELFFSVSPIDRDTALIACHSCPVAVECLRDALAFERLSSRREGFHGIRGGLTAAKRRKLARRLDRLAR